MIKLSATTCLLSTFAAVLAAGPALAEEATADGTLSGRQYVLDLGAGGMVQPKYPGADEYIVVPYPIIAVSRFYIPGLGQVADGEEKTYGFSIYPSFNFYGERKASDSNDLEGTKKVDWSLELGLGVAYRYDWVRGFVEVRQGFNGYSGQVADFGLDFIAEPAENVTLVLGPRATWSSSGFMDTYFGVTPTEAMDSGGNLQAYNADSGFRSVGLAARASYGLTDDWTFHVQGGYDRLIGDAADSPITERGSENQFTLGAGVTYRFAFDVFE